MLGLAILSSEMLKITVLKASPFSEISSQEETY